MHSLKKENLYQIIDKFNHHNILVLGDIILDEYIWGKASRLSPEAPVPVLEVSRCSYILGGASNVAHNISTLGGKAFLAGIVGEDIQSGILVNELDKVGINSSCIIKDIDRPTTLKTRLIAHNHQQLARADREIKSPINENLEEKLYNRISAVIDSIDLVLLSDYSKGVLTPNLTKKVIELANKNNKPILVDPKGLDYTKYNGATLITPNRLEAEVATQSPSGTIPEILANLLLFQINIENVLITLGEEGLLLVAENNIKIKVPAVASEVYDVTGAGDSLIAALALGLCATGMNFEASIILGNYAAGIAVRKTGTTAVKPEELKNIIEHHFLKSFSQIVIS